jgi:hypothetical protein
MRIKESYFSFYNMSLVTFYKERSGIGRIVCSRTKYCKSEGLLFEDGCLLGCSAV